MSIQGIAWTVGFRTKEDLIQGMMARHPVTIRFLEGMLPTIDAIFTNVPGHLRGTMMSMTIDAFRRQSLKERAESLVASESHLDVAELEKPSSRRRDTVRRVRRVQKSARSARIAG